MALNSSSDSSVAEPPVAWVNWPGFAFASAIRPSIAVTSLSRSKLYPDLGTVDELGVPGYEVNTWMGVFAPAGIPKAAADRIGAAIKDAVAMPDVRSRFESTGANIRNGSAEEMRQVLAADIAKWAKLVQEKHITFEQQ